MIAKSVVLLGVQHLQQRTRRVASEVRAQLVDLVQQEQRIARAHLRQALQHLARQRADVRAAVPTDFSFVAHATQGHAHVLAARGLGNGLPQRGLAHARWPHQAQDGSLHLVHALLHRKIFKDAVLYLVQAKVVFVEHAFGIDQVMLDLGLLTPRQRREHVNVVTHHGGLGRHGRHQLELLEFCISLLARLGRHLGELDLFLDLLDVRAFIPFAQLLLDGLDLLVQVEVALVLLHLALHTPTDLLVHVEDVHLAVKLLEQVFKARLHIRQVQHHLLVLELERQVRGDGVGQTAWIVDAGDRCEDLRGNFFVEFDVLVKLLHHSTAQRFNLARLVGLGCGFYRRDGGREMGLSVLDGRHQSALMAFDQHLHGAVRQLEHLQDGGDAADIEHVRHRRLVLGCSFLCHKHDATVGLHGQLKRLNALGTPHKKRDDHVGKHHHVTQRQQR
ncbi:hypothetical protein D3C71_1025570 [compost metagenome]